MRQMILSLRGNCALLIPADSLAMLRIFFLFQWDGHVFLAEFQLAQMEHGQGCREPLFIARGFL